LIFVGLLYRLQQWPGATLMIIAGASILPITFIVWNRILGQQLILRKQAESKLEVAWEELSEKNSEIIDSISYARRIQRAILPPDKLVKKLLSDSFVLYTPKDVVAGDFYWLEKKGDKVLFAAADGIEGNILEFSGAHNPLWIVRDNKLIELKGDKQPVGNFEKKLPFTNHSIELVKGDVLYVFSDGYVDQFGGEKGKKFKPKALRELILNIHNSSMQEQKERLHQEFEKWRGKLEQVDDVCVIGVRI